VTAIVLDVSSPGGSVGLLPEIAAQIRAARGTKPIVAVANTTAASAAYWIASQADELVVTPSGDVGSIGVFAAHEDISAAARARRQDDADLGGQVQDRGQPVRAALRRSARRDPGADRRDVRQFVADVAAGRGVDVSTVVEDFGQGRMLSAKNALRAGMVDRIDTFEATVHRLMRRVDGRLTATKREQLAEVLASLEEADAAVRDLLAATDPERDDTADDFGLEAELAFQRLALLPT
jgi:ClpP class serine protease